MYALDGPLTPYVPPAAGWNALLASHGAHGGADAIVSAYAWWCHTYQVDTNLALAQACHECAYFNSQRWGEEWNPAGLGITSDNAPPAPFASLDEGIRAHIEHLCCYVYTAATCPCDHAHLADRRHFFHDGKPAVQDLVRLPARAWANPGVGYAASIVSIANSVGGTPTVASAQWLDGSSVPIPTAADIGYPVNIVWAADYGNARALSDVQWFVVHTGEGGAAGDIAVLTSANQPVESAHAYLEKSGRLTYMVPIHITAWTAGNDAVSAAAIQVEQDAHSADNPVCTDAQYRAMAAFYRWCVAQGATGIPAKYIGRQDADGGPLPDVSGIIGHRDVPDGSGGWGGSAHHQDPGIYYDWARLVTYMGNAPTPQPAPVDERRFPETGHAITGSVKGYWEQFGTDQKGILTSVRVFGFPVSELVMENGVLTQYFERAVLENHSGDVKGRRLGSAAAAAAGLSGPGIP